LYSSSAHGRMPWTRGKGIESMVGSPRRGVCRSGLVLCAAVAVSPITGIPWSISERLASLEGPDFPAVRGCYHPSFHSIRWPFRPLEPVVILNVSDLDAGRGTEARLWLQVTERRGPVSRVNRAITGRLICRSWVCSAGAWP
jgi:hypothetical protein